MDLIFVPWVPFVPCANYAPYKINCCTTVRFPNTGTNIRNRRDSSITTKTQTTHSSTFRPTEAIVTLTHALTKTIYQAITTNFPTTTTHSPAFETTEELVPLTHAKTANTTPTPTTSNQHAAYSNLHNKKTHGTQQSVQHKVPPHRKQRPKTKPSRALKK
eukprot:scaffold24034_cov58-Attheya_sp.AAC.3